MVVLFTFSLQVNGVSQLWERLIVGSHVRELNSRVGDCHFFDPSLLPVVD
ncbi:hypothetical protein [Mastigocladopsis repens]|nr:hypothetical protein [Mastigocladopsis repens]